MPFHMPSRTLISCFALLTCLSLGATPGLAAQASPPRSAAPSPARSARATPARPTSRPPARPSVNEQRALDSYAAMQRAYYLPSRGLYKGSPYADAWPYSQAMAATISVASLPQSGTRYRSDVTARLRGLQDYADTVDPAPAGYTAEPAPPIGRGDTRFNDDNEWIATELLRSYQLDHQAAQLAGAEQLMSLIMTQWNPANNPNCPGGVVWHNTGADGDRNTVSNAPGAALGAQLYMATGRSAYLQFAVQMYDWVRGCLLQADGLYADHITPGGSIDPTEWTYNQGSMIGAGAALSQATHDPLYLRQAQATARTAMARFGAPQLAQQPTWFNAIYIRNLLILGTVSGDPRYQRFVQGYADDAWSNIRDETSGLFLAGPGGSTELLDQAAMVQVYALLAQHPACPAQSSKSHGGCGSRSATRHRTHRASARRVSRAHRASAAKRMRAVASARSGP